MTLPCGRSRQPERGEVHPERLPGHRDRRTHLCWRRHFPGPFLGTEFGLAVFDDDGANGLPGTMLDCAGVTVNNYGWVELDWLNAEITDGNFYLAMVQVGPAPFVAPIGIDTDIPTYFRSYSKFGSNNWMLSGYQDFMMRAWLSGPQGDMITDNTGSKMMYPSRVPANWQEIFLTASGTDPNFMPGLERNYVQYRGVDNMASRDVVNYRVARYSNFDPNGSPSAGTTSELANTGNLYYNDYAWAGLPQGWVRLRRESQVHKQPVQRICHF